MDNENHCVLPSKATLQVEVGVRKIGTNDQLLSGNDNQISVLERCSNQVRKECPEGAGFWRWRDDTGQLAFGSMCLASTGSRGVKKIQEI